MIRPLEGYVVVAFEHAVAAPFASRQLADLGATVIKVERPSVGDFARYYDSAVNGQSSFFVWLNRGKQSLTLDLKHPDAKEVLAHLVAKADVIIQNLAPGAASRLGISYEALAPAYPKLVVCDLSGYGKGGPFGLKKAYDLLIQAESGIVNVTGSQDQPSRVGVPIADIAAGMYAQSAVMAALLRRSRTGAGASVGVSMLEALSEWMGYPMYYSACSGKDLPREPMSHVTIAPYGRHRVADGAVIFGVQNEREWERFCIAVVDRPEWLFDTRFQSNQDRCRYRAELTELIENALASLTSAQVFNLLDQAGIANGNLGDARRLWSHPQFTARDRWRSIQTPNGSVKALLPPFDISEFEPVMGDIPAVGEHTDLVLGGLGFDPSEIDKLRVSKAV